MSNFIKTWHVRSLLQEMRINKKTSMPFKSSKLILSTLLLTSLLYSGCGDSIDEIDNQQFTQPQPVNTKSEIAFPSKLKGSYRSLQDSSILNIQEHCIVRTKNYNIKISNQSVDSLFMWKQDSLIDKETQEIYPAQKGIDSTTLFIYNEDTVFQLNRFNNLKYSRKQYFLNIQQANQNWVVKIFAFQNDTLILSNYADTLTKTTDTLQNQEIPKPLNVSKRDFRKLVKQHAFTERERFIRIN